MRFITNEAGLCRNFYWQLLVLWPSSAVEVEIEEECLKVLHYTNP